jgi:GTPase SAR1 family protein
MRDGHCAVLAYDLTDQRSFVELDDYKLLFANANPQGNYIFAVVGTKLDIVEKDPSRRAITPEQACNFATRIGACGYYETSSESGRFVAETFESIANHLSQKVKPYQQQALKIGEPKPIPSSRSCCSGNLKGFLSYIHKVLQKNLP